MILLDIYGTIKTATKFVKVLLSAHHMPGVKVMKLPGYCIDAKFDKVNSLF
jgi:hypothetical protein